MAGESFETKPRSAIELAVIGAAGLCVVTGDEPAMLGDLR
jgi:hypothetical protein